MSLPKTVGKDSKMAIEHLIFDGRHLLYRTVDAFRTLSVEVAGREIGCGGMYGFLSVAMRVFRRYGGICWVAWEGKRDDNWRIPLFPEYKKRPEMTPDEALFITDMCEQELRLKAMLRLMGVRQYEGVNCEADDVIAWIVKSVGIQSVIVYTGDSDLRQLVRKGVTVISPGHDHKDVIYDTAASVKERHGVYPNMLPDLKALAGDHSDNIPGVRGIGQKTAEALVDRYGDVRKVILAAAGQDSGEWPVAERFRQKILDSRRDILLFKKLTKLTGDVEVAEIARARDQAKLRQYFMLYRFRSLLQHSELTDLMNMGSK